MAKSRRGSRKGRSRKSRGSRRQRGGVAPVGRYDAGSGVSPMELNLEQGKQFFTFHKGQHGGMAAYPGSVVSSSLDPSLVASAKLSGLNAAFDQIKGLSDQAGGRRRRRSSRKGRKGRKNSRKNRKNSRKNRKSRKSSRRNRRNQMGGAGFVPWGGGSRRRRRSLRGGSRAEMGLPMDVAESSKMLIPQSLQAQAGLNPEWRLAENPNSFAPLR